MSISTPQARRLDDLAGMCVTQENGSIRLTTSSLELVSRDGQTIRRQTTFEENIWARIVSNN
jgi:hypothetical protein